MDGLPNGWKDTSKKGNYNPGIISVQNGVLNMRMRTVNGVPQIAAPEPKLNGTTDLHVLYGRFEVRFRADPVALYKLAWLTWPKSETWPRDGEIDFVERSEQRLSRLSFDQALRDALTQTGHRDALFGATDANAARRLR